MPRSARSSFVEWGNAGLIGHAVPRSAGGRGDGFGELVAAHEAFGKETGDTGLVLALNAHVWGTVFPILRHGTDAQRDSWCRELVAGTRVGGHAISEPQAGSDLQGMQAQAESVAGGFRLSGHKRWATNTPDADLVVVYARHEGALSAFVVLRTDAGVRFAEGPTVEACESAGMGDVVLDDCRLPADRLLGKAGNGGLMIQQALELERAFIFAGIAGIMERQIAMVIRAVRSRRVGGGPLAANPAIAHRIAEMRTRLDTLKLWIRHCATLADAGRNITMASSQAKLFGAEAFLQSSLDAVHLRGASGLETGEPTVRWVRDAMASRLFSGSSEVQRNIIAAMLGIGSA